MILEGIKMTECECEVISAALSQLMKFVQARDDSPITDRMVAITTQSFDRQVKEAKVRMKDKWTCRKHCLCDKEFF